MTSCWNWPTNVLRWFEQTAPLALMAGILLGFLWSPDHLSCLEIPLSSRDVLENYLPFNRLQARSKGLFLSLWLILVSLFTGSLIYFLLNLSAGISGHLNFAMQVLLAWQAFPFVPNLFRLSRVRATMFRQGTLAGLELLAKSPSPLDPELGLVQKYQVAIRGQIDLLANFSWLAFGIFFLGSWPFLFFYLAFLIQYRTFQLANPLLDFCLSLSANLQSFLLRFYLHLSSADQADKKEFRTYFLNYQPLLEKKSGNKSDGNDQTEKANLSKKPEISKPKTELQLNLAYLSILNQLACLSLFSLTLLGLSLLYLRNFI